ncbi:MAG: tRNA pseudouridine(38-40) synthase TruA [Chloroflexi bacterium]|nr:tRNA pseudouridine(38-40) synthase TruA [Chloroflexota bacterium]
MPRFAARLAYDGTAYFGFQRQKTGTPTIQSAVENALETVNGTPVICTGAGRTDTGVHASGQVISWEMAWEHQPDALLRAINAHLPPDIAVQAISEVGLDFHPRFDAIRRTYVYRLYSALALDPLRNRYAWHFRQSLSVGDMITAASLLIGEHDFATFGQPTQGTSTVRQAYRATLESIGDELHVTIEANAFLQRMVRSIVGTLVEVGRGKMCIAAFHQAFQAADRAQSGPSAPAHGLRLAAVDYAEPIFDIQPDRDKR